ncbi:hypothetical protein MMAD_45680 [Mycolicibacterium madagascariense]|uniref:Nucleotidyltransferase n=1 Tax=Mycolicibacterium madagascariense TaxID=212765 RepID=A0A7I7XMH9_9MYCO|nr:nucleotidyltransferase [Mycolicibacterium madagascariense]MCV7012592.1 nucleotidyltransferase [Mycolicibacterium madagascariense]BBZ30273.1 hypothetical protein MMAD_45680 [Mycolicibacterium madagascariense]
MTKNIDEAFRLYLGWQTPSEAERTAAAGHRQAIYTKLNDTYGLHRMFETGSFKHGTGVSSYSDVDYFASLKSTKPQLSSSILTSVRDTLKERFPYTYIHVSRPAVVLDFNEGREAVEVIPAYAKTKLTSDDMKFNIPGVVDEWLESTPEAHAKYVNESNNVTGVSGGAKSLARLAKAWKYHMNVPISSFYLEMRAASYMRNEQYIDYPQDLKRLLGSLKDSQLAAMNDPTGNTGRIEPCSSQAKREEAISKLDTANNRADWAVYYQKQGKIEEAFEKWDLLFGGSFPSYY